MTNISYKPTEALSYDPAEPKFWDRGFLKTEIERAFEICHGCRMCFKYCEAFPSLFALMDGPADGDVRKIDEDQRAEIFGHCFQCKLCEVQCPYTPRDGHEFQLDFPKLVHRYTAVKARADGISPRDKMLGDPDGTAKVARASLGMANTMNRVRLHRVLMEKATGIHRDKLLPDFAGQTFEAWAHKAGRIAPPGDGVEAVLFPTCFVQNNDPQLGRDTLTVLDRNGIETACAAGLECCGMPAWEHGDLPALQKHAARNLDRLTPYVDAGAKVVAINPTCSMMLRREYPTLVATDDRPRAARLAAAVRDPGELLWSIRGEPRFSTDFKSTPGEIAYHAPCHLRTQGIGFKGRDLLRKIPGATPRTVMECCGHDGTFSMRVETFDESKRVGQKAFDAMTVPAAETWVTECPLAAMQFEQHAGKRALHPMTVLARAYREDGFATRVPAAAAAEEGKTP